MRFSAGFQNIAHNLPHLRGRPGIDPYLLERTDTLTRIYAEIRQRRSDTLTGRQYKAAALWQVVGHGPAHHGAGLLVVDGQLTVGQFAAAEVLVGNLLLNMDTLARRMVAMFFTFVSCREMAAVFSLPTEEDGAKEDVPATQFGESGIRLTCRNLSYRAQDGLPIFKRVFEVAPERTWPSCAAPTGPKPPSRKSWPVYTHPRPDLSGTTT